MSRFHVTTVSTIQQKKLKSAQMVICQDLHVIASNSKKLKQGCEYIRSKRTIYHRQSTTDNPTDNLPQTIYHRQSTTDKPNCQTFDANNHG